MEKGKIAGKSPQGITLEQNKNYFWCACGESNNQPFCDGSHRHTDLTPRQFTMDKSGEQYLCMCKQTNNPPFCDGTHNSL